MKSKKILIFSSENDWSTTFVMDWIAYYGYETSRINEFSISNLTETSVQLSKGISETDPISITFGGSLIRSLWLRRPPKMNADFEFIEDKISNAFLKYESKAFDTFLHSALRHGCKVLGNNAQYIDPYTVSKLECLILAQKVGLSIPKTLITTSKNELIEFVNNNGKCIFKPLSDPIFVRMEDTTLSMYTTMLDTDNLQALDEVIYPAFIQQYIDKAFEIRTFYMDSNFYSSAIFSQNDSQTEVDFRNYNDERPNRTVPFNLPKSVERKLKKLFDSLGLNTGSVDFICSKDGDYCFLEINPIGQFGMVSFPCNYYIEKKIATYLMS